MTKLLEPYKLGRFQAAAPTVAAALWPDVAPGILRLRLEGADGELVQVRMGMLVFHPEKMGNLTIESIEIAWNSLE